MDVYRRHLFEDFDLLNLSPCHCNFYLIWLRDKKCIRYHQQRADHPLWKSFSPNQGTSCCYSWHRALLPLSVCFHCPHVISRSPVCSLSFVVSTICSYVVLGLPLFRFSFWAHIKVTLQSLFLSFLMIRPLISILFPFQIISVLTILCHVLFLKGSLCPRSFSALVLEQFCSFGDAMIIWLLQIWSRCLS